MKKQLFIKGIIADNTNDFPKDEAFTLNDAIRFFSELDPQDDVDIFINSPGGSVYAGDNIYSLIKQQSKVRNITTTAVGICHSIATKIFLAVPKENRFIDKNCDFLIHLPLMFMSEGEMFNRLDMIDISKELGTVEKDLISLYEKNSNLDKSMIQMLMENEASMDSQLVIDYGFASKITYNNLYNQKITNFNKEILIFNLNSMKNKNSSFGKFLRNFTRTFLNSSKGRVMIDMTLKATDSDGTEVTIETPYEDLITGDPALIGNEKAIEGDYTLTESAYELPVGTVIKIGVDGDVMEIIKPEASPQNVTEEEVEKVVEELTEIIADQQEEIVQKEAEIEKLNLEIVALKGQRKKPSGTATSVKNMTDPKAGFELPSLLSKEAEEKRKSMFEKK